MKEDPVLLLRPKWDSSNDCEDEAFQDVVDALLEGSYEEHHASSDGKQTTLAYTVEAGAASDLLGAGGIEPPRSIEVIVHDDHRERDAVAEATACLSSPHDGDGDMRKRMEQALATIVAATGDGAEGPLGDGARIISSASPWGPMAIVHFGILSQRTSIDVPPELASLLPQIVDTDWRSDQSGDVMLSMKPLSVTVWRHDPCPVETMRLLAELRASPPIA